jgi:uncharacterized protein
VAAEDLDSLPVDAGGDLLEGVPAVSPLAWSLAYAWPVHRIGPEFQPKHPGEAPTYLVVHRNRRDEVKFMEANAVTARLLELLRGRRPPAGRAALARIARELKHPQPEAVVAQGASILASLRERDIILGTWRVPRR